MWYDSYDNGEPLQLSQDNDTASYQLFGTLSEKLSQDDFDDFTDIQQPMESNKPRFPTEAWPQMGYPLYIQEFPPEYYTPGSHVVEGEGHAQSYYCANPPENLESDATVNDSVESKSAILNKIQNLRSTSFTLDEEIEEQKRRNASLLKQIAEAKEQVFKMKAQSTNLQNEHQEMEEKNKAFELKVDQETKQLVKSIATKRRSISEIKDEANMVPILREEKDKVAEELKGLRRKLEDVDLDIYWLEYFYKIDFDKMIIFPFWKLEEDLERAIRGEDPTLYKEEGPQERDNEAEGDGYDYEDHDFFDYEEMIDNEKEEKSKSHFQEDFFKEVQTPESDTCQSTLNKRSGSRQRSANPVRKFRKFIANVSFGRNSGRKKRQKKDSKSSRFGSWLRRLSCIPKGNKDD